MTESKTFIVLGVPRSGTSMIAGIMRILGVYMGERIKPDKHEDLDFLWQPLNHVKATVEKRNRELDVWGWKDPNCARYIKDILPMLINPHFVYIRRKLIDTVKSDVTRNRRTTEARVRQRNINFRNVYDRLNKNYRSKSLLLSYELCIETPIATGALIADFIGSHYSEKEGGKVEKFVEPGNYKAIK